MREYISIVKHGRHIQIAFITKTTVMINPVKIIGCFLVALTLVSCTDEIDAVNPPAPSTISISGTLPVLYIDTENNEPIVSKEVYLNAT